MVHAQAGEAPQTLLARVGLAGVTPQPVIVVCGGADDLREPQLSVARAALGPAIRDAVSLTGAAVVDGGTAAGVMELLGAERARDSHAIPVLLGVAPAGKVGDSAEPGDDGAALDHNHTHFILADSDEWGGETSLLASLAEELSRGGPVVMVVAGGGRGTRAEVREAVARRWPLFAIDGTGGVADRIAAVLRGRRGDMALLRDLAGGDARPIEDEPEVALRRALAWELQDEPVLKDAWALFASYDRLAVDLRGAFERFQSSILGLGILATAVALTFDVVGGGVLHWSAVALPIVISILVGLANRRAAGKRWVLLRAAAEAVKSEIYRYRTATGVYSAAALASGEGSDGPRRLAERLAAIESGLMQTDASGGPLPRYAGPLPLPAFGAEARDDGLSRLDAASYAEIRVDDQLRYYRRKVQQLDRRRVFLQGVTLIAGGAGALLAAAGAEIWIGLTTTITGAAIAYLGYLQIDNTIVAFNHAAAQLAAMERELRASGWTTPLSHDELERFVTRGEAVMTTELGGWVQQMTDALAQLQAEQSDAAASVDRAAET